MSIDTEITGKPGQVESAATWLRDRLRTKAETAADDLSSSARKAESSWHGTAGEGFRSAMRTGQEEVDSFTSTLSAMATDLDSYAHSLRSCQDDMETIRADARTAGLTVSGLVIQEPGPGPARPTPPPVDATHAEATAYEHDVERWNEHQALVRAYNHASNEAGRVDRAYAKACRTLQDSYTATEHAAWVVSLGDLLGGSAEAVLGYRLTAQRNVLHQRASGLIDDAERALREMEAHPERYLKRKWFFLKRLDGTKLADDAARITSQLDEADDLLKASRALEDSRALKYLSRGGKILGPLGIGLGVYNDYQEGESATQIAVSQGGSVLAGMGTGAAVGAAVGSVVPVAGTAVGAVAGAVVGAGVSIFADGAIDSFFENGPDVGAAFDAGVDALEGTGDAIASGVSSVGDTIGGWFD